MHLFGVRPCPRGRARQSGRVPIAWARRSRRRAIVGTPRPPCPPYTNRNGPQCLLRVNRVDFATSALASAIHNTGHHHVRLRPVCWLLPAPGLLTTGTAVAAPAFCPRPAKRHELHPRSTKTPDINCAKSARNLLAFCLSWFCPIAVWRRIAQNRRGADHRPLDSRIKGARCAAVGRQTVQRLIATFLAWPHLARIQVLFCAQQVSAMCC